MSIRILGGVAKGFEVVAPKSTSTRPTSVLLRRRFFDSHQDLSGIQFIDLCAGSGSMGFEALSRGAVSATFIEESSKAFLTIKENSKNIKNKYQHFDICYEKVDAIKWLKKNSLSFLPNSQYFLYFDPPYDKLNLYDEFFDWLKNSNFQGRVIVEACRQKTMPLIEFEARYGPKVKSFEQGTSFLIVYDY